MYQSLTDTIYLERKRAEKKLTKDALALLRRAQNVEADASVGDLLRELEQAIWKRRPILGEIISKNAHKSLYDYTQGFIDVNPAKGLEHRKAELIEMVQALVIERLGTEVGQGVARQLSKMLLVSTADHHGPINNPFFVNSNIISAIPYVNILDNDIKYLIDFSFASISVNNSSFPRGVEFNGDTGEVVRIPILPDKLKMGVAYTMRSFTEGDLDRAFSLISEKEKEGHLTPERSSLIQDYIRTYFGRTEVLNSSNFVSQITKLNYAMWPSFFSRKIGQSRSSVPGRVPDLVYVEIETLVARLLLRHHIGTKDSLLHKLLFDSQYHQLVLKFFNNLPGAFSLQKGWGSFLFWTLDDKGRRVSLFLRDGRLVSANGEQSFTLTPEAIADSLEKQIFFPGMLLCYLVVALYYGVKCLGGFSQVHDLTVVKNAWRQFLQEAGEADEANAIIPIQTKELGGDGMVLAYVPSNVHGMVPAFGLEIGIGQVDTSFEEYIEYAKMVTVSEALAPLMPEVYNVLFSQDERQPHLTKLKSADIVKFVGMVDKLTNGRRK